jgi:hypothetical protein
MKNFERIESLLLTAQTFARSIKVREAMDKIRDENL